MATKKSDAHLSWLLSSLGISLGIVGVMLMVPMSDESALTGQVINPLRSQVALENGKVRGYVCDSTRPTTALNVEIWNGTRPDGRRLIRGTANATLTAARVPCGNNRHGFSYTPSKTLNWQTLNLYTSLNGSVRLFATIQNPASTPSSSPSGIYMNPPGSSAASLPGGTRQEETIGQHENRTTEGAPFKRCPGVNTPPHKGRPGNAIGGAPCMP